MKWYNLSASWRAALGRVLSNEGGQQAAKTLAIVEDIPIYEMVISSPSLMGLSALSIAVRPSNPTNALGTHE